MAGSTITRTIVYTYDKPYHLTDANYSTGETYVYSYDPVGNRLQQIINGNTTSYQYDAANRLVMVNGQSYTFDNNGNLLNTGVSTNTFDVANRLISTNRATTTLQVAYNGLNDRLAQTVGATTTHFALDGAGGLPEVISTTNGTAYLHLPGVIVAQNAAGERVYLLSDGLGSVRQVISGTAVVEQRDFDPYGNPFLSSPPRFTPYAFTGEWWEQDVGLLHLRARWYLPESGTFLSRDSFEGIPSNPATTNGYNYANQNPINLTDRSGLSPLAGDPYTACMQMPVCWSLVTVGGGTVIGLAAPPLTVVGVLVIVPAGLIYLCTQFDCSPQPSMPPVAAPTAPPIAPPYIGTPPACYWSADGCSGPVSAIPGPQPGGTPTPSRTPWPFPIPVRTPRPPATCTPDDPDNTRRFLEAGPGYDPNLSEQAFTRVYKEYFSDYDKFVGAEPTGQFRLIKLEIRQKYPHLYDENKLEEYPDLQSVPNQYADYLFAMSPGPEYSNVLINQWRRVTKSGAPVYFILDSETVDRYKMDYNKDLPRELELAGFDVQKYGPGQPLATYNRLVNGLESGWIGGRGNGLTWWGAYRRAQ